MTGRTAARRRPGRFFALLSTLLLAGCATTSSSASPAPDGSALASAPGPLPSASAATLAPIDGACGGTTLAEAPWWQDRVFYEVFVRSFQDSDGDGIGDLRGLTERLDYLNDGDPSTTDDLGVTGIWLMPIAESPSYHGYDVTDYTSIEADYGTTEDFEALVAAAHERGIAVIVDQVLNHTSVEHPWFEDAKIPGSPHDAWYEWSASEPGVTKPGGGRVWHRAGSRFYYSYFWEGMADLNLANPEVTAELDSIARYWLEDLGVDGFRMDAVKHLFEQGAALEELPETHAWLEGYQDRIEAYKPDALLVGEVYSDTPFSAGYVPDDVDLTFDFGFAESIVGGLYAGGARTIVPALEESLAGYPPGQRAVFLTNHDQTRVMDKISGDIPTAKAAAALLLTSPGVPFLYYGEEVGLEGDKPDERIRTPMPWEPTLPGVGFTTGEPWQPPSDGAEAANVATQTDDPASLLSAYRDLIHLRADHPALAGIETVLLTTADDPFLAQIRAADGEVALVVTNFGQPTESPTIDLSGVPCVAAGAATEALYGTDAVAPFTDPAAYVPVPLLEPYQTIVVDLGSP